MHCCSYQWLHFIGLESTLESSGIKIVLGGSWKNVSRKDEILSHALALLNRESFLLVLV